MKIFLIGMMGSGKTYWAKQLSQYYQIAWIDLDNSIEQLNNCSINTIFETKGEIYFREQEQIALHQTANTNNLIIATGGGTPCFHDNMQWMNEQGITIFLNENIEVLAERLMRKKEHRPLIKFFNKNELLNFLKQKIADREVFYQQAKYTLHYPTISMQSFDVIFQKK